MRIFLTILSIFTITMITAQDLDFEKLCKGVPNEGYIASPSGEEYYIQCFNNIHDCYEDKCPDSEPVFDPQEHLCVPRKESTITTTMQSTTSISTTLKTTPTTIETTPTTLETTITTTEKSTVSTTGSTSTSGPKPEKCPVNDDPKMLIMLSDKESCTEYFICYHGKAVRVGCPNLLQFDSKINKCDFADKVNCTITDNSDLPKCKSNKRMEFYEHPQKCNYFISCMYGYRTVQQCPYFHHWNQQNSICIQQNLSDCIDAVDLNKT